MPKNAIFSKFQMWIVPESAENRPICGRKVRLVPKSSQNLFYVNRTKFHDFKSKNIPPPKKKRPFFFFFLGGGGGGVGKNRPLNPKVSWAE